MTSLPGSPQLKQEGSGGASAPLGASGYSSYEPVIATHKQRAGYICPAVRVRPLDSRELTAVFPLSREEIGEIWTTLEELRQWEFRPLKKGWADAWWEFRQAIDYPPEYLTVLLNTLRSQQFLDGSALSWRR